MKRRHLFKTLLGSAASVAIPFKVDAVVPRFRNRPPLKHIQPSESEINAAFQAVYDLFLNDAVSQPWQNLQTANCAG